MNQYYEWPKTRQEANIFFKECFKVPNFWKDLAKKFVYAHVSAAGDTAIKLSVWQSIYGGTWSPQEFVDYNSLKGAICGVLAFGPTAPLTVPFENARRAYYADKTWPHELRRNYTSPTNALLRIPFEEGPTYLFKGGIPIALNQFFFWTLFASHYIFLKNRFHFFWTYMDLGYDWCKLLFMGSSFLFASWAAYPMYFVREMVDIWPKERGGFCTWNNNYRQCLKWMLLHADSQWYNWFRGWSAWQHRYGIPYFIAIWMADSLGMFTNCNEAWNSVETQFPIYVEST